MITENIPLFLTATIMAFLLGGFGGLIWWRNQKMAHIISSTFAILGSICGITLAATVFMTGSTLSTSIATGIPFLTATITIDSLAAVFVMIISLIALACSIYGYRYMEHYKKDYALGFFGFFYNLFLLSMILVVTSSNGLYFLFVWEIMSLTSLFLVIFEHKQPDTIQAGIVYFIMTHTATAFIMIAFFILFQATGSFDFSVIHTRANLLSPLLKNIVFICALIGFGTKAGIIPLHIWLPRAHGAAPSHVSSLMSGVMIKLGIFMMIRIFFFILPQPPLWWGITILLIGATSSVLGVLYALAEHDIKRLLAYHSIENIGIILLGLGSSLIFINLGLNTYASLALVAALFHTMNHAVFKSLLFLGAGSVISQTHTRNIEEYGGLIKKMPYTALFFLIGAIAISGLPPFNGFASEWLTYQGLFKGIASQSTGLKTVFIIAISSLAFTGGLAAACFVKAFGITFLARPRSEESKKATESSFSMVVVMGVLATFCLALGLGASQITRFLTNILQESSVVVTTKAGIHVQSAFLNLPFIFIAIIIAFAVIYGLTYFISRKQKETIGITWICGFEYTTPRAEITATGFSRSLILIFRGIFKPTKQSAVEYVDANTHNPYVTKSKRIMLSTLNTYEVYFYKPVDTYLKFFSENVKKVQNGNINLYLLYIFITLIAVLIWVRYF